MKLLLFQWSGRSNSTTTRYDHVIVAVGWNELIMRIAVSNKVPRVHGVHENLCLFLA